MVFVSTAAASKPVLRSDRRKALNVKPGDRAVRPASLWPAGSSLPRTMRHRSPRKVMRAGAPHTPSSPHQDEASNLLTGRRALGPWLGPFSNHPDSTPRPSASPTDALLPHTMYIDTRGAMHLGLDTEEHRKLVRALQEAQEENGMLSQSTATLDAIAEAASEKMALDKLQLRKIQARQMQNVYYNSRAAATKSPRAMMRRMRHINQPRRMN